MTDMISRMIRFGIVGASGILVDFSITWLFKERLKLNKFVANSLGFITAVTTNYLLNRVWTFQNTNPQCRQAVPGIYGGKPCWLRL